MNLQSKFNYCIISQTLNTALCVWAADLSGQGHKKESTYQVLVRVMGDNHSATYGHQK